MFAAFTVVAMWLGWNVYLVRQRRQFIAHLRERSASQIYVDVYRMMAVRPPKIERDYDERSRLRHAENNVFLWPSKDDRDPFSRHLPFSTYQPSAPREEVTSFEVVGDRLHLKYEQSLAVFERCSR